MKMSEHQKEILKRDLDQLKQWKERTHSDIPNEFLYDIALFDAFCQMDEVLEALRNKLERNK